MLKVENRQLKDQIKKLRELVSTDKNLKQMKSEYNECLTECKQILEQVESMVHSDPVCEVIPGEQLHMFPNSMTMTQFEQNFVNDIQEAVTQGELLTVRDIQKIRMVLKSIFRHVMRLTTSPLEGNQ